MEQSHGPAFGFFEDDNTHPGAKGPRKNTAGPSWCPPRTPLLASPLEGAPPPATPPLQLLAQRGQVSAQWLTGIVPLAVFMSTELAFNKTLFIHWRRC